MSVPDSSLASSVGHRLRAACLCGAIEFEIDGPIGPIGHCHCRTCQKSQAAAFATTARVARSRIHWQRGQKTLRAFESSPGKKRFFCPECGGQLYAAWDHQDEIILRVGCLLDDPGTRPLVHIWTQEKAPWLEIHDALPQFPASVPKSE